MADDIELGVADYLGNPDAPILPRLKESLFYGVQQSPDVQANMRDYSRRLGVPLPAALGDPEHVNALGQVERLDPNGMILGAPRTANWLAEPDNAAVAHDDIGVLQQVERTLKNIGAGIGKRNTELMAGGRRATSAIEQLGIDLGITRDKGQAARLRGEAKGLEDQAEGSAYTPGTTWEEVKRQPLSKFLPFALEQGIVSLPDMIGSLAALPLYVTTRTGEIGQQRAENDARQDATAGDLFAAMPAAVASAALERIGTKGIIGIDEAVAQGVGGVVRETGKAAVKEGVTEAGQEAVEGLGATVGTKKGVNLGQLADQMLAAGVAGAGFGGTVRAVTATTQAATQRQAKVEESQAQVATVQELMTAAQGSALRARDPQTFKEFVDAASEGAPVEKVYVHANDLAEALTQGAPEQLAQNAQVAQAMPSVIGQLQEALPGNGLVEIPVSELLAFTPDSSLAQSLIENLKVDPNGMSMREADEFMQTQAETLKAEVAKAVEKGTKEDAHTQSAEVVRANIQDQLDTVNRFTSDVNQVYAGLVSAFYATQAARLGVTPEALFEAHPLTVKAAGVGTDALTQGAAAVTDTPEFKAWFGGSKVVSESGAPLVVYHGTSADVQAFDPSRVGSVFGDDREGFFFTNNREPGDLSSASDYATNAERTVGGAANVMPVFVALKNPLVVDSATTDFDGMGAVAYLEGVMGKRAAIAQAKEDGHDGIIVVDRTMDFGGEPEKIVVAFEPTQIKSAFNGGQFDPENPNILEQPGGATDARGTFSPVSNTIVLLRNADLSTFLHELGHFYLETLARLAADPNAPVEIKEDFARALAWMVQAPSVAGPDGALAQFAGEKAVGFPAEALERAKDLESEGELPGIIEDETGWFRGHDGRWRFEISDHDAAIRSDARERIAMAAMSGRNARLSDVLDHPKLYRAYPALADTQITNTDALNGSAAVALMSDKSTVLLINSDALNDTAEFRLVLLHEVQHLIQHVEGFATGASVDPQSLRLGGYGEALHAELVNLRAERPNMTDAANTKLAAFRVYRRSAGEIEARNTEKRADMTPEERADLPHGWTEDTKPDQAIVRFGEAFMQGGEDGDAGKVRPDLTPEEWLALPVDERRAGHELFARGFEAYLREGKAPAPALTNMFRRFKAWLTFVYQSLTQLNVELTDEVRGVFDRLLATDVEIAKAEAVRSYTPVLETKPAGMSDPEWEDYQRLGAEATATANDDLAARSIRDMRWLQNKRMRVIRELQRSAAETRKAVRAEVEAETLREPVYAAQQFLRRGVLPDGQEWTGPHKLTIADVAAIYEGVPAELRDWQALGYGRYGMLAEEGADPEHVAELFGFSSGHEMVEALLNADPLKEVIEGRTDQRMLERYGDLKDQDAIERAADEAIHNDARLRFVATEAAALAKAAGKRKVLAEAARDFARELVGRQRIRDLKPGKYTGAETKAAAATARAAAKGDLEAAATEKRNQLINGYAAKAAFDAQADVEKALRYLARFDSAAVRKAMDPDYRDQIDALLERFDLRKGQSLKAIDKRKSLKAWIEAMQARGLDPIIDEQLANEAYRKHYRDLTVDELRGLVDAVKNIAHLGKLKHRLLVAAKGRAFQAVVDEAEAAIRNNAYRTLPEKIERNTVGDRILSGFANFGVIHRKFASLFREMQGLQHDGGILWRAFVEPMNKANDTEAAMREQATVQLAEVFKRLPDKKGDLRRKMFIPEIGRSLSLEGRLAVALNWGNELNRARIMDGDGWSADQVTAVLSTLTAGQLDFVNAMWEYLDSYWPEIAAKERRVTGVEPVKVEAEPFDLVSADGQAVAMRGGYYPIKYDTDRSSRSEADEIAENVRAALRGAYTRATTRRGHTKARVEKVERPVRKDLMVPFQHVNQVIHDLAFHEYLIDATRLISAPQIDAAIRDHYGVEVLRAIKQTIDDMAEGDTAAENSLERAMNYVRTGTTIAGLGWNLTTGLLQPLGLSQSIVRIGPKYMAKGIGRAFADAATLQNTVAAIGEKSDFMRLRAKTFMREVSEVQNTVKDGLKPEAWGPIEASFFYLIQKLQLVADVPTWLGAYAKAQDQGHDDETAVALADQAVRDSQGGGQLGDLAQIQRGNVWFKLWTNFYSFFNVGYNQMAESLAETRRVGAARLPLLAADVLLIAFVPVVLGELMKHALRGEEWDWDELGPQLAKAQASYLLGFMVGLRELGGMITSDGKAMSGPASLRLLTSDLPRLYTQVQQGELDDSLRKAAVNTAGVLFHFPSGQINRTLDGLEALAKGETRNPLVLAVGPPRN